MFQYYRSFYGYVLGVQIRKQLGKKYIYQVVGGKQIKYKYVVPGNPRTYLQQLNRWRMKQAVLSWQSLTDSVKNFYRSKEPFKKIMSGYNYYISAYIRRI